MRVVTFQNIEVLSKLMHDDVEQEITGYVLISGKFPCLESIAKLLRGDSSFALELDVPEHAIVKMTDMSTGKVFTSAYGKVLHREFYNETPKTFIVKLEHINRKWLAYSILRVKKEQSVYTWDIRGYQRCMLGYTTGRFSVDSDYVVRECGTGKVVDFDRCKNVMCGAGWLVLQALESLQPYAREALIRGHLNVDTIEEAYRMLNGLNKIYLKDWGIVESDYFMPTESEVIRYVL